MPWNPKIYNQFKDIRFKPFYDLAAFIQDKRNMKAIDLGCGTGEQTAILSEKFPTAHFTGVDSSPEMLDLSEVLRNDHVQFRHAANEDVMNGSDRWDLIFSNAALQWSDDHEILFPKLIATLNSGGQLAVQMPYQPENILNKILFRLAEETPFKVQLNHWNRPSSVLTIDQYAQIFFDNGLENLNLSQRVYPIIAETHETLFNFIAGSALVPYLERLNPEQQESFKTIFKNRIAASFPRLPAIYAFKRLLLYGTKK